MSQCAIYVAYRIHLDDTAGAARALLFGALYKHDGD